MSEAKSVIWGIKAEKDICFRDYTRYWTALNLSL